GYEALEPSAIGTPVGGQHDKDVPLSLLATSIILLMEASLVHAQATRTWVSGVGDDANSCSRTAPCETFAGAISKTAAGGDINCTDPGGFGAVTIDRGGTFGSILAAGTNGVNINAANIVVGPAKPVDSGATTGLIGINAINMLALHLDNVMVMNFNGGSALGLRFAPSAAGAAFLNVNNSYFWSKGNAPDTGANILIQPFAPGAAAGTFTKSIPIDRG